MSDTYKEEIQPWQPSSDGTPAVPGLDLWYDPVQKEKYVEEDGDKFYRDARYMNRDAINIMKRAIEDHVINPQADREGNQYFNPDGFVTTADVLNMIVQPDSKLEPSDSPDGVSKKSDYFNTGYLELLQKNPQLEGKISRSQLFLPVNVENMFMFIKCMYDEDVTSPDKKVKDEYEKYKSAMEEQGIDIEPRAQVNRISLATYYNLSL